jgi:insertion element IS1 protein InsB
LIENQITIAKNIEEQTGSNIEIDEMWHYIQNKESKCWIWIAICKVTKLIFGYVTGSRGAKTGKLLFDKLVALVGAITATTIFHTDWWEPYTKFLPTTQHRQGKDQTYTIEGYNSNFRDDLQRLTRRTKAYSKSQDMLNHSINIYIHSHNEKKLAELKLLKA